MQSGCQCLKSQQALVGAGKLLQRMQHQLLLVRQPLHLPLLLPLLLPLPLLLQKRREKRQHP
jgi:hypothetical protein